jgi:hypothetical protein
MAIWRITDKGPTRVAETRFKQERFLEEKLEEWVIADPSILGEPILVIGRQVLIPDTKDRLDILALDPLGNSVIVELKRGHLKDPVDIQALRYASYISKWRFEDFENQARNFLGKVGDPEFNFNSLYEGFCEESGVDEIPTLNQDQRVIIVGSAVREKLGSVALWLRDHSIDITVIEVHTYKEGEDLLIQPSVIVPLQVSRFAETGRIRPEGAPWVVDGKAWHLDKRCSPRTKEMFLILDKTLQDRFELDGPRWNQKYYVSYRVNNYNWLAVITTPNILRLDFLLKAGGFKAEELAKRLGVVTFDKEESLSEKLGLPSSILVKNRNENTDRVILRVKEDFDLSSEVFLAFLNDAHKAVPK